MEQRILSGANGLYHIADHINQLFSAFTDNVGALGIWLTGVLVLFASDSQKLPSGVQNAPCQRLNSFLDIS